MKIKLLFFTILIVITTQLSCQERHHGIFSEIVGEGDDQIEVVVVSGTPHEMGYSLGKHLKVQALQCLQQYLDAAFKANSVLINPDNLSRAWETNLPFMDKRFLEEMEGFSQGSGIDMELLRHVHAITFIAPYACSGVCAWGKATVDGELYQIRNLDYSTDAGLQKHPVIVIYKPDKGIAHANITYAGILYSHSGINARSIVLGEKGESPFDEYPYDLKGKHFTILFRELLYDAKSLADVERTIEHSPLVKRYYLFAGDGKLKDDAAVKYLLSTPDPVKLHKWADNAPNDTLVPQTFDDITYETMKNNLCCKFLEENYGNLNADKMIRLSKLVAANENLVDIVYNATTLEVYVSNATGNEPASQQKYVYVDLKKYFK
jgi:isopenicillin-N N-acyltransferase like protein